MMPCMFDVTSYGAVGDGKTKDTAAIQRAIDACAAAGGGQVVLPAGTYVSGTVYLHNDIEFHLQAGATLLGSTDRDDYNADDAFPENFASERDNTTGAHLIIAYNVERVSITGSGTIDGNSASFFGELPEGKVATAWYKTGDFPTLSWRTSQMVYICRSRDVSIRDVHLVNSPYWTCFILGCERVSIRGVTIANPPATRNGDGIDIDCSRYVTISDCIIRTGDDCITLRGHVALLGEHAQACEHVTVTNCILSTPCSAIRVGVGTGDIRDCTFSNIVVQQTRTAVSFNASYSPSSHGTCVERIHFSDLLIDALNPFVLHPGPGAQRPAAIRDVRFSRCHIRARAGSQITGTPLVPLERITLEQIEWVVIGGTTNVEYVDNVPEDLWIGGYQGVRGAPALPCVLYGRYLEDLHVRDMRVRWEEPSAVWNDGIWITHSSHVAFRHVQLRQPQHEAGAAIRCTAVQDVLLHSCQAAAGTTTFLRVEEAAPDANVRCIANDWTQAQQPIHSAVPVQAAGNLIRG